MKAESIARVDAWLEGRPSTGLSVSWGRLAGVWWEERQDADVFQVAGFSDPESCVRATEAALMGILLALVRLVWGDPYASTVALISDAGEVTWVCRTEHGQWQGEDEMECLVEALVAKEDDEEDDVLEL